MIPSSLKSSAVCALLCAALSVTFLPSVGAQPADLVTAHGREFAYNGKAFRFVGMNIRGISHYGRGNPLIYTSLGDVDTNLDGMVAIGGKVVRLFAANKFFSHADNAAHLEYVLDRMQSRGLKAIVAFTDLYTTDFHPQGDDAYYMSQPSGWTLLDDSWFKTGYTINYVPFVETVVNQLKDHPAIFAWELGNELTDIKDPGAIIPFTTDMAARVKAIDPYHMFTTGFISVDHTQIGVNAGLALYANPNIDFMTVHSYNGDDPSQNREVHGRLEIPLLLEEYGWARTNGDRVVATATQIDKWYDVRQVRGMMNWGYQAQNMDIGDGDGIFGIDRYSTTDYDAMTTLYKARADYYAANPIDLPSLASPQGDNLALSAVEWRTDSNFSASYGGDKAIDGIVSGASKWTSGGAAPPHWIALDLGVESRLTGFIVRMAGEAETVTYDFTAFQLQSAPTLDGPWTTDFTVDNPGQFATIKQLYPALHQTRCVRLYITNAGIDAYARLPEFEVWGYAGPASVECWNLYE